MSMWNYSIDLDVHGAEICQVINDFTVYCLARTNICVLRDQFKFYDKEF